MQLPRNAKIEYTNWQFKTRDENLLKIGSGAHDKLLVIFGEQSIYWLFYTINPRRIQRPLVKVASASKLGLTYCDCCLDMHYLNIIDQIKNHSQNKNK